jgi:hypothetical protein
MGAFSFPVLDDSSSGDGNGGSSSGWLSGLGDLFAGIGAGVGAGIQGSNMPTPPRAPSGWVFNQSTGQYYNPSTGQALTATGTLPSMGGFNLGLGNNSGVMLLIVAVIAFLFLRKR